MYKQCATCKEHKSLIDFRRDSNRHDGRRSSCKICSRAMQNRYYDRYAADARARTRTRQEEVGKLLTAIKGKSGCWLCSETEPACLDFHHIDPTTKMFGLGGNTSRNLELVLAEINKCAILCKNDHTKVHEGLISLLPTSKTCNHVVEQGHSSI